ncbi:hypothetical protein ACIRBX_09345 [Kitasatospora sp. NPDC096147]|uniref:hypothetical protein n=1 Tax=Kitasatospora sp. NPDC096147 TaxID=3364093 RepID=UPI00380D9FFF
MAAKPTDHPDLASPAPGRPGGVRTVPLGDLRSPGTVLRELTERGEVGRITDRGRLVAWLVPTDPPDGGA